MADSGQLSAFSHQPSHPLSRSSVRPYTHSPPRRIAALLALLSALLLSGCVTLRDPEASQVRAGETVAQVDPNGSAGQSFVSRRRGLNSILLWISLPPEAGISGTLQARLYHANFDGTAGPPGMDAGDSQPLRTVSLTFAQIRTGSPVTLSFTPLDDPAAQAYYLELTADTGGVQLQGHPDDVYARGSAYLDGQPLPADLAFETGYQYGLRAILGDLAAALPWLWLALPLAAVLILPGWLLLGYLPHPVDDGVNTGWDFAARIALALGLSLAIIPLALTWTTALGLRWNREAAWFVAGILAALAVWRWLWRHWRRMRGRRSAPVPAEPRPTPLQRIKSAATALTAHPAASLALIAIFAITLFARFVMVRDLAAPPWVDSVHHGVITHLILDQGAYPASYAPYLEIDTARYHAGFHAGLAFFIWLSGLELHTAMLWYGQVLNALIVFPVYLLAVQLSGSPRAGLFAALIAGLFTPMPAYYTSWGRYTQLAGMLILPVAYALIPERLGDQRRRWNPAIFLAAIACAGLFLNHYRVAAFLACLLAARWLVDAAFTLIRRRSRSRTKTLTEPDTGTRPQGAILLLTAALSALLALPWLPETFATLFVPKLSLWQGGNPEPFAGFAPSFLNTAWGNPAMVLAAAGLALGLVQLRRYPFILGGWAGLMILLANLEPLGLPGGGFVTTLSVTICLFMPLAVAGGAFMDWVYSLGVQLLRWLPRLDRQSSSSHGEERSDEAISGNLPPEAVPSQNLPVSKLLSVVALKNKNDQQPTLKWLYAVFIGAATLIAALFAARAQVTLLRPVTFLAREADFAAIHWAAENLSPGETALVNPAGWGYGLFQGEDGGYWLSPLAGIKTMPPPVIYGLDNDLRRVGRLNALVQAAVEAAGDPPALHALLLASDIRYVFIGAKGGVISPQRLADSGFFRVLYRQDGAWILHIAELPSN